jgi:hypothetical protein
MVGRYGEGGICCSVSRSGGSPNNGAMSAAARPSGYATSYATSLAACLASQKLKASSSTAAIPTTRTASATGSCSSQVRMIFSMHAGAFRIMSEIKEGSRAGNPAESSNSAIRESSNSAIRRGARGRQPGGPIPFRRGSLDNANDYPSSPGAPARASHCSASRRQVSAICKSMVFSA